MGVLEHAADDLAVRCLIAWLPQPDFPDAPNGGQRGPQFVRDVRREPPHLLERRFEPTEGAVEHHRQPPELVGGIVDRETLTQALGRDGPRPLGHSVHRGERAAREPVAAETRGHHAEGEAEQEDQQELTELLSHGRFRRADLKDDGPAGDRRVAAQDPERHRVGRHRYNPTVGVTRQPVARGHGQTRRHRGAEQRLTVLAPDLEPGAVLVPRVTVEPGERAVGALLGHLGGPPEVATQAVVQRLRDVPSDEGEHGRGVHDEHEHHRGDVPQG